MDNTKIKSIGMGSVYAVDYKASYVFYNGLLGLHDVMPMGDNACYFRLSEQQGLYLAGSHKPSAGDYETTRTTFTLDIGSAGAMYEKLNKAGIKIVQTEPVEMGPDMFWFQCYDPSGNIVEFLGGK
jgi:predicted enzyme related to lactoylglutathione lyase